MLQLPSTIVYIAVQKGIMICQAYQLIYSLWQSLTSQSMEFGHVSKSLFCNLPVVKFKPFSSINQR